MLVSAELQRNVATLYYFAMCLFLAVGMTHNQGVPGSCPGGPTAERQNYQGFMLLKA
jgi:hypothetical protein